MDGIIRSNPVRRLKTGAFFKKFGYLRLGLKGIETRRHREHGVFQSFLERFLSKMDKRVLCALSQHQFLSRCSLCLRVYSFLFCPVDGYFLFFLQNPT